MGYAMCFHISEDKAVHICISHIWGELNPHVTVVTAHLNIGCALDLGFRGLVVQ